VIYVPRTREQLQKALADIEAWLDSLDPKALASPDSDGSDLYAIGEALRAVAVNDLILADQVAKARANGRTWTQIAAVLGVTKQAARERFGEPARRLTAAPKPVTVAPLRDRLIFALAVATESV
jgi:hypothetical protein